MSISRNHKTGLTNLHSFLRWIAVGIDRLAAAGRSRPNDPTVIFHGTETKQPFMMLMLGSAPGHRIVRWHDENGGIVTDERSSYRGAVEIIANSHAEDALFGWKYRAFFAGNTIVEERNRALLGK